jgi:NADPH:quinone reductase
MKAIVPDGAGGVLVMEVDSPRMFPGAVLCRLTHSLISPGTERAMIRQCAGESPEQNFARGVRLGYNAVAVVEEVTDSSGKVKVEPGRKVAIYGGPYVFHGQYCAVPPRLLVPLPEGLAPEQGVFTGLCAISLHGIRMGRAGLGEVCIVAGLGLIGNFCAQLALVAGGRVIASDYEPARRETLLNCLPDGADARAVEPDRIAPFLKDISGGRGADVVFLCMSTPSDQPVKEALEQVRPGGRIVILGDMDIRIPRNEFFAKEAEFLCSRAAGPGRYDPVFERQGVDYPGQYVRWTEEGNLAESLRLIASGRIKVEPLISSVVPVSEAPAAYQRLMQPGAEMGVILHWS